MSLPFLYLVLVLSCSRHPNCHFPLKRSPNVLTTPSTLAHFSKLGLFLSANWFWKTPELLSKWQYFKEGCCIKQPPKLLWWTYWDSCKPSGLRQWPLVYDSKEPTWFWIEIIIFHSCFCSKRWAWRSSTELWAPNDWLWEEEMRERLIL